MFHHESRKSIYFGVKRLKVKVTVHKNNASVDFLHPCECWLLLVILATVT